MSSQAVFAIIPVTIVFSVDKLRETVQEESKKNPTATQNFAAGYGGKFGVQADRKDKVRASLPVELVNYYHEP